MSPACPSPHITVLTRPLLVPASIDFFPSTTRYLSSSEQLTLIYHLRFQPNVLEYVADATWGSLHTVVPLLTFHPDIFLHQLLAITGFPTSTRRYSSTYYDKLGDTADLDWTGDWLVQLLGLQITDSLNFRNMPVVRSLFAVTFLGSH